MPQPVVRARSIAARLSAIGLKPRLRRGHAGFRVEVTPPVGPSAAHWTALLAALEQGDQFGLRTDGVSTVAWALVLSEDPAAPIKQGPDPQP